MVGRRREEHVGELSLRGAVPDRRDECSLGAFRVPYLDEVPEPGAEPRKVIWRYTGKRVERDVRRPHDRVGRNVGETLVERGRVDPPARAAKPGS